MSECDSYQIVPPPVASDLSQDTMEEIVANDLVDLTAALVKAGHEREGGMLGGQFGYGVTVETDAFSMHPYCWCQGSDCGWCDHDADDDDDSKPSPRLPHFAIKGTPIEVRWYKWIGRSMQILPADLTPERWRAAFVECLTSVRRAPANP